MTFTASAPPPLVPLPVAAAVAPAKSVKSQQQQKGSPQYQKVKKPKQGFTAVESLTRVVLDADEEGVTEPANVRWGKAVTPPACLPVVCRSLDTLDFMLHFAMFTFKHYCRLFSFPAQLSL